jgi:hypothetical protein
MSLGRARVLLVAALLYACGSSSPLPAPDILSVTPNQVPMAKGGPTHERTLIRVSLDAVIPVRVDYGEEKAHTDAARVWIGSEEAPVQSVDRDGTLVVEVPETLLKGTYDVRIALSDGREAVRVAVLTVVPKGRGPQSGSDAGSDEVPEENPDAGPIDTRDAGSLPPDAGGGNLPDDRLDPRAPMRPGDITGFQFEAVGDQTQDTPFLLVVRALGPRAAHFQEYVELTLTKKGTVTPSRLGPFTNGVCEQRVSVDAKGGNVKLTVTDAFGAQGSSNGFKVK